GLSIRRLQAEWLRPRDGPPRPGDVHPGQERLGRVVRGVGGTLSEWGAPDDTKTLATQSRPLRVSPPPVPPAPPGAPGMPPSPGGPQAYRESLLKAHLRAANAAYRQAVAAGAVDPVVVVGEVTDPKTGAFTRALLADPGLPAPPGAGAGTTQTLVFPAERAKARAALRALSST